VLLPYHRFLGVGPIQLFSTFFRLVESMNPKAQVKSETTFSKRVCPLLYTNIKTAVDGILNADLPSVSAVHFTSDHWSSRTNDAYQALTVQYITPQWELKKWTVECRNAEGRHTGELVAALTDQMIRNIPGLRPETLTTITTDSAANMRKAMREALTVDCHLRCVDHIINTCVTKALDEEAVSQAIQKCRDLATATHRSSLKTEKLRNTAIANGGKFVIYRIGPKFSSLVVQ
jgi:hypothetical protein